MNLLLLGNFSNPSWDGSLPDEEHLATALEVAGHTVGRFQREDTNQIDWPIFAPQVIIVAQWSGYPENIVARLRHMYQVPVVYYAFDYQWDSQEDWHFRLAKEADLFLSKELDHQEDYLAMGAKFYWFSQDFAPLFLDRFDHPVEQKYDVVFTGSYLPQATLRNDLLKAIDARFNLHVFTVTQQEFKDLGLKHVHPPRVDHDLPLLIAQTKINLSCDWKQADGYWSDRVAQILCCGGFVINKFVPLQEVAFPRSVVQFDTIDDCLTLIQQFLPLDAERQAYANYGYEFAQRFMKVNFNVKILTLILQTKGLVRGSDCPL